MRLLLASVIVLLGLPSQLIAQSPTPLCHKNVLIYFDNSASMKSPAQSGGTIRDMMQAFLQQALDSPDLITENDSLTIKLFVDKAEPVWASPPGQRMTPDRKRSAIASFQSESKNISSKDNDFITLASDFESELRKVPEEQGATTYFLVFSDFFYDPSGGEKTQWDAQRNEVQAKLASLAHTFEEKKAKLVIWYQKNERGVKNKTGTELIDLFRTTYSRQIENSTAIPQLVKAVNREFRLPLVTREDQSYFLYGGDGLKLNLTVANPNCSPTILSGLEVGRIGGDRILAEATNAGISKHFEPGAQETIVLPLKGYPKIADLRSRYLGQTYKMTVHITSDVGATTQSLTLPLTEASLHEKVEIVDAEAVLVRHILNRSMRAFIRLNLKGNLLEGTRLDLAAKVDGVKLILIDPKDGNYKLEPKDLTQPRVFIFSFPYDQDRATRNHSTTNNVNLLWNAGIKSHGTLVIPFSKKDYRLAEWTILAGILILGFTLRIHYARHV